MTLVVDSTTTADLWQAMPDRDHLAAMVLAAAANGANAALPSGAEVSIVFCDEAAIRDLNRDWRGIDKPTNVLSFPAAAPGRATGGSLLGDIVIAFETTAREAAEERKPLADHVAHLLVHGFLHLVGHDHEADAAAAAMETLERRILQNLGIADPYSEGQPLAAGGAR